MFRFAFLALVSAALLSGSTADAVTRPLASVIVTVADHKTHAPRPLTPADLGGVASSLKVVRVEPLRGDADLVILIDDHADFRFTPRLAELKRFVTTQPAATAVGVAFVSAGDLRMAQPPTQDRQAALRALRNPAGGGESNPFCALSGLILNWPGKAQRREVVLITSGIDYSAAPGAVCSNAETAISDAERAGVIVYALYNPAAGYEKEDWKRVDEGLVQLSHVCFESGGEAYFMSHRPAESFIPFLDDIGEHLANEYLVTGYADPIAESGFQRLHIDTGVNGPEIMAPARIWLDAKQAGN